MQPREKLSANSLPGQSPNQYLLAIPAWLRPEGDEGSPWYELYVRSDKLAAIGAFPIIGILRKAEQLRGVIDELNPTADTYLDDSGAVVTVNP